MSSNLKYENNLNTEIIKEIDYGYFRKLLGIINNIGELKGAFRQV